MPSRYCAPVLPIVVAFAVTAIAGCGAAQSRASRVTGTTYCGGIMDPDLGDRLATTDHEDKRFFAVIDTDGWRPVRGNIYYGIQSCTGTLCFANATKKQLFEMCGWVGVREISAWDP
jgi:hypothetical protein